MSNLGHDLFANQLNTSFKVKLPDRDLDLRLADVTQYMPQLGERKGMERFSLFFEGPPDALLPQAVYSMTHDSLGTVDIFIVPIAGDTKKIRYEAVFNYFKGSEE